MGLSPASLRRRLEGKRASVLFFILFFSRKEDLVIVRKGWMERSRCICMSKLEAHKRSKLAAILMINGPGNEPCAYAELHDDSRRS